MSGTILVHQLANGFTVLGCVSPRALSAAMGVFVRSGARDEVAGVAGISHLIEHMLFKGTQRRSALELTYATSNIGAQANAYTSEEMTVYYGAVLPSQASAFQEILLDMMAPSFPADELELERGVIIEEIAQYEDRPHFLLFEKALKEYFGAHPAGNSILGTRESVGGVSRECIQDWFSRHYTPSQMVLTVTGNIDWDAVVREAEALMGDIVAGTRERLSQTHVPAFGQYEYRKKDLHQCHLALLLPGPSAEDPDRYAVAVLTTILGDATGSKLYFSTVETGLAESASMEADEREDTGCLTVYAATEEELVEPVVRQMKACLERALDFSDEELESAKRKIAARMVQGAEVPLGELVGLGGDYLTLRRVVLLSEHLAQIRAVTREDIIRAVSKFPLDCYSEFRLIPE